MWQIRTREDVCNAFKNAATVIRVINYVRVVTVVTSVILTLPCLYFNAVAQPPQVAQNQSGDARVRRVLESLEQDNTLGLALERGERGRGPHYEWMDRMQQQGIRQASFRIRFHWGKQSKKLKITDSKYLRRYYRFDTAIDDQSMIKQIRAGGLEQALHAEILRRAKASLLQRTPKLGSSGLCGTLYLNLLDDEVLPILDEPAVIENDCKK